MPRTFSDGLVDLFIIELGEEPMPIMTRASFSHINGHKYTTPDPMTYDQHEHGIVRYVRFPDGTLFLDAKWPGWETMDRYGW